MGISLKDGQYMRELGHGILPAAVFRCVSLKLFSMKKGWGNLKEKQSKTTLDKVHEKVYFILLGSGQSCDLRY